MAATSGTPSSRSPVGADADPDDDADDLPDEATVKADEVRKMDEEVDEWEQESFPASDPPANW